MSEPGKAAFPIVGIGASAGGLQAFEAFLRNTPANSGMAFVLVSHLDPDHASILHELLQKSTAMPVRQITDGTQVKPNRVYVSPPGKDVALLNGTLQLMDPTTAHGMRLPIDHCFRSLARDQGANAVGIILSGNASDGTLGIRAIKGESGVVMAQDPDSARFPGMPASAISTGLVDFVLPPDQMPPRLLACRGGNRPANAAATESAGSDPGPELIRKIILLIRTRTGHDFSCYKNSNLRRRIERRMGLQRIDSYEQYIRYLEENPAELDLLFRELLIGVTDFFRDPEAFDALATAGLAGLIESKEDDAPLRVWVPGCSTGEEAFSIAIVLRETMERLKRPFRVQIFATDLDRHAIARARTGEYSDGIASKVAPERLQRFFTRQEDCYRIHKAIRDVIVFAEHDLTKDPPFAGLDLVSCRNLLIYLQPDLQKRILALFDSILKPGGLLFLGPSETVSGASSLFTVVDRKWRVFRRKEGAARGSIPAIAPSWGTRQSYRNPRAGRVAVPSGRPSVVELSSRLLADRYAPASVIVNDRGDIIYIHGDTGLYLQPAPGEPSQNVLAMAREGLRIELASAIHTATLEEGEAVRECIGVQPNGNPVRTSLRATRILAPESLRGLILITFVPRAEPAIQSPAEEKRPGGRKGTRLTELERELEGTRTHLQHTIEALQTSNEELRSTNEELQAANEEMQSANEELETSKEEMQSLNEELQTVNSELQGKNSELSQATDDLRNLLNATNIATLYLDNQLHIRRFTTQATELIRLIPSDVGRPLADIVSKLDYQDLERDAAQTLETLSPKEAEVRSQEGTWYLMRILPYRTVGNMIDGLVVTFVNIDTLKRAEQQSRDAEEELRRQTQIARAAQAYAESIVDTVREPLVVLDADLRIRSANRAFYRTFRVAPEEALSRPIYELGDGEWDISRLRELFDDILAGTQTLDDFEIELDSSNSGHKRMLLNARRVEPEPGRCGLVLLAIEDITERRAGGDANAR